eukprot:s4635_g4.t1
MKNFREHIIVRGEHNILMIAMVQPEPPGCARISGARHNRGRQHPPCGTPSDPSNWNPVCAPYTPLDLPFTCKASSCCPSPLFTLTLNMRAVTWCWTLAQGSCLAMPYCDNVHVIGKESGLVERHRLKVCECLREKGFQVHEEVPANDVMPTLGGIVDGSAGVVRATPTRFWKIIVGFEHCLRKPVSSDFVRRLLGHAMVHRCEMAVFRTKEKVGKVEVTAKVKERKAMAKRLEHLEPCKLEKVLGLAEAEAKAKVEEKEEEKEKVRKEEKARKAEAKAKAKEKVKDLEELFVEFKFVTWRDAGETNAPTNTQLEM